MAISRSCASTIVTRTPNRANTCASSTPIAPPPSTSSDDGTVVGLDRLLVRPVRRVRQPVDRRDDRGRADRRSRRPRLASMVSSPTAPASGRRGVAVPRTKRPPLPTNRSTATLSSQLSVASSRIRLATGAQSGSTVAWPAMPGDPPRLGQQVGRPDHHLARDARPSTGTRRRPGAARCRPRSRPASASLPPTSSPPTPSPTTTTSTIRSTYPLITVYMRPEIHVRHRSARSCHPFTPVLGARTILASEVRLQIISGDLASGGDPQGDPQQEGTT